MYLNPLKSSPRKEGFFVSVLYTEVGIERRYMYKELTIEELLIEYSRYIILNLNIPKEILHIINTKVGTK